MTVGLNRIARKNIEPVRSGISPPRLSTKKPKANNPYKNPNEIQRVTNSGDLFLNRTLM